MPSIRYIAKSAKEISATKALNWFPGHMYSGMQAMIGKLNTIDCVVEVHDARIPFTGRNSELKRQLGTIKPHVLVLNKVDLADLSRWNSIKRALNDQGDRNILLTDLSGSQFSISDRGYPALMNKVVSSINQSDRYNRQDVSFFKVMIVGIPNVGKSTLINRLRQHHLGLRGSPAKTGPYAGVTRHVDNMIKICARPLIYSIDTPGILKPGSLKNENDAMRLALCSTINDSVLDVVQLAQHLLDYLNARDNQLYQVHLGLSRSVSCLEELIREIAMQQDATARDQGLKTDKPSDDGRIEKICWQFIKGFRRGCYGKVMLDE